MKNPKKWTGKNKKPLWWDEIYSCYYCGKKDYASELNLIFVDLHGKDYACDECLPKHEKIVHAEACIRVETYTRCEKCEQRKLRAVYNKDAENRDDKFDCICLRCGHEFKTGYK